MKTKKRDIKRTKPSKPRYPQIISEDRTGTLIRYSRNAVGWIPNPEPA